MPISANVIQPTGVTATFHMVTVAQVDFNNPTTGNCTVFSYLSDPRVTPMQPLITEQYDISSLVSQTSWNSQSTLQSMIENYLISNNPIFNGGTQVN